jgi:hypothetical protein
MRITHTTFFRTLCRLLVFCLAFQSLHPSALHVPSALHFKFSTSNDGALTCDLRLGPSPAYGQVQDLNLASTPEADLTDPFLINKAAELNHDPVQIFAFMRNEIGYEAYSGSLRGTRGTLWSRAGNALDQASLMIALLRASSVKARYVKGTLGIAEAQRRERFSAGSSDSHRTPGRRSSSYCCFGRGKRYAGRWRDANRANHGRGAELRLARQPCTH